MLLINLAFHAARLALGVTLEQAMDASWVIRPAVGPGGGRGMAQGGQVAGPLGTMQPAGARFGSCWPDQHALGAEC